MGVNIYYRGKMNDVKDLEKMKIAIIQLIQVFQLEHQIINDDWDEELYYNWGYNNDMISFKGNLGLKGISILFMKNTHLLLTVNHEGYLCSMEKQMDKIDNKFSENREWLSLNTQNTEITNHILICDILKSLKQKYFSNLEIVDKSAYYHSHDLELLIKKRHIAARKKKIHQNNLSKIRGLGFYSKNKDDFAINLRTVCSLMGN